MEHSIQFTGDSKGMSVHNFLERVEEMRIARNVSESQVFDSSFDLFADKSLLWYRSNCDSFSDWKSLSELLKKHQPPDFLPRLFRDIMNRSQDPSESFIDYLTCMNSMIRSYGHVEQTIKLGIITRNLAPFYSTQLPSVNSLQELEDEC
ncbi:hypothetical protein HHI36_014849 [Cryptolaemus montrouzieri]|uniref:Retrotransposon gag domain-containing protein n=1 Tax=Cryptolaemus montrouzieri TaxID=559131 RepID=A0ABD2N3Y2_9CUCU